MKLTQKTGIGLAVLAAALYAISAPLSKLLLAYVPSTLMAGFLYLGAGLGMSVITLVRRQRKTPRTEEPLTRTDLPYTLAMIVLDIAAPILLLLGLSLTTAANASLLNNFEIVATALIALCVFRERISPRLWAGIGFVTVACALLTVGSSTAELTTDGLASLRPSVGSLCILAAAACWGIENNCTRRLSVKDPLEIVLVKGLCSGTGSLIIGLCRGERVSAPHTVAAVWLITATLAVGFVAYGMSIFCYVYAQRMLGAARTGAYYAIAPFIGTLLSLAIFRDAPPATYFAALALMAIGAWLSSSDGAIIRRRRKP